MCSLLNLLPELEGAGEGQSSTASLSSENLKLGSDNEADTHSIPSGESTFMLT